MFFISDLTAHNIYVSPSGVDEIAEDRGTEAKLYRTIQYALDSIPMNWYGYVTIYLSDGTYSSSPIILPAKNIYKLKITSKSGVKGNVAVSDYITANEYVRYRMAFSTFTIHMNKYVSVDVAGIQNYSDSQMDIISVDIMQGTSTSPVCDGVKSYGLTGSIRCRSMAINNLRMGIYVGGRIVEINCTGQNYQYGTYTDGGLLTVIGTQPNGNTANSVNAQAGQTFR